MSKLKNLLHTYSTIQQQMNTVAKARSNLDASITQAMKQFKLVNQNPVLVLRDLNTEIGLETLREAGVNAEEIPPTDQTDDDYDE